jgi:hypothetical protein
MHAEFPAEWAVLGRRSKEAEIQHALTSHQSGKYGKQERHVFAGDLHVFSLPERDGSGGI